MDKWKGTDDFYVFSQDRNFIKRDTVTDIDDGKKAFIFSEV